MAYGELLLSLRGVKATYRYFLTWLGLFIGALIFHQVYGHDQFLPAQTSSIDPRAPNSPGRLAVIEAFKREAPTVAPLFQARTYTDSTDKTMPYRLSKPPGYRKDGKYPLVVYLHSAGGSGTDNIRQLQGANLFGSHVRALPENQRRFPKDTDLTIYKASQVSILLQPQQTPSDCSAPTSASLRVEEATVSS